MRNRFKRVAPSALALAAWVVANVLFWLEIANGAL